MKAVLRPARAEDAPAIVQLATDGFHEERRSLFVYSCTGADAFVRNHIATPPMLAERHYSVAEIPGQGIVGVIDLVRTATAIHLAYVAVAPEARGQGLAQTLLSFATYHFPVRLAEMQLDVFSDNRVAVDWYDRLGFESTSVAHWFCGALPVTDDDAAVRGFVSGMPVAEAAHARFGFSQFTVHASGNDYSVGRLGEAWFRVSDAGVVRDLQALHALRTLDARRGLLVVTGADDDMEGRGFTKVATAQRRRVGVEMLLERLRDSR
ncbi:MAG: N-acetyltransferase [bacterium]